MDFLVHNYTLIIVSIIFLLIALGWYVINKIIKWIFSDCVTYYDFPDNCNECKKRNVGKYKIWYLAKESVENRLKYLDFYEKRKKFKSFIGDV